MLRRKVQSAQTSSAEGGPGADRAWRVAFARAARDMMQVPVDFLGLSMVRLSLNELLDLPPERALILMLEGPEDGLGLFILAPDLLAAFIEVLTIGHCGAQPADPRKPTRTDAAMLSPLADIALSNLEDGLSDHADLRWTSGFRYASFIEEARPLGLLLEDIPYRTLTARLSLGKGDRTGDMMLVLPAEGRGRLPRLAENDIPDLVARPVFAAALAAQVEGAPCQLDAVIARLTLPLSEIMHLRADAVLPLPVAGLDRISVEGLDGRRVAGGKLGQNRGLRAVRIVSVGGVQDAGVNAAGQVRLTGGGAAGSWAQMGGSDLTGSSAPLSATGTE